MTAPGIRTAVVEELLRRFAAAMRGAQLYAPSHPFAVRNANALLETLREIHQIVPALVIGLLGNQFVVGETPLPKVSASLGELIRRLQVHGIERITIDRGILADELVTFVRSLGALGVVGSERSVGQAALAAELTTLPHIRVGRLGGATETEGIVSDMAAIRRLYAGAVAAAESVWESALTEGNPDLTAARGVIDGLAEAVTQNRTALVALTAMKTYDNYTFTHMVNVSILAMGQARALGIEGRLLREFGLSALMHDIGKVRTPKEVLNKPEKLTDAEFAIMKRHTVDGAEILRRTPEMPVLAPVVAFEHHLRLDGTGYPEGASRGTLNLATMLCSVADVYDAMRSQRAYQEAFPTERILAVLKRNDGQQFDQHLVRRFVQLLGIYPPGTLVRLSTAEIAVVTQTHAPDPYRPRVHVLFDASGERLPLPIDRNLWQTVPGSADGEESIEGQEAQTVTAPLDPAEYGVDPLTFL